MFPTIVILAITGVLTLIWLCSAAGRDALRTCMIHPRLLAPALFVLGVDIITDYLPSDISVPFFKAEFPGLTMPLSVPLLTGVACHILGAAWLIWMLAGAVVGVPCRFGRTLVSTLAILVTVWVTLFASFIPMALLAPSGAAVPIMIVGWGIALYWLNCRLAGTVAALPLSEHGDGFLATLGRVYGSRASAFRWTVLIHLLFVGGLTLVWLDGYTTHKARHTTVLTAFNWKVNAQCVLNLTLGNSWPAAIVDATRESLPKWLTYGIRGFTALLCTIFITAYAAIGSTLARRESPGAPAWGQSSPGTALRADPGEI